MMKKLVSLFMAMAMVFSLSATAFAANTSANLASATVTVTIQQGTANSDYTKPPVNPAVLANQISVTAYDLNNDGEVSVKEVVNAILGSNVVTCANEDSNYGCDGCTCESCTCTWKKVALVEWDSDQGKYVPTGDYGSALNSLTYGGQTLTNRSTTGSNSYEGYSWEYWVNGTYADDYMDQHTVTTGNTIILSYDYSKFTW